MASLLVVCLWSQDEVIDVIEGNRKYIRCLYAYNKVRLPTLTTKR